MGSLRGHTPNSEIVAGNRDFAHVLLSPRVGAGGVSHSPFNPMSRRSLSQKRMGVSESSSLLFKLLKDREEASPRDNAGNNSNARSEQLHGHRSRFGDNAERHGASTAGWAASLFPLAKRNWRHAAFFCCALLVSTFMLLKVLYLGVVVQDQQHPTDALQVHIYFLLPFGTVETVFSPFL